MSTSEAILLRRVARERAARVAAEQLLEEKSRELHQINQGLRAWNESLEEIVRDRTSELTQALEETKEANLQVEHQALHDPLTGLANRRYLKQVLQNLGSSGEHGGGIAMLHIDLDRFKRINDTRGHSAGDYVLTYVASVLQSLIGPNDFVARIGGDEFVIVVRSEDSTKALTALANRIISECAKPVFYGDHLCRFGASIGIAYSRSIDLDPFKMLVSADIALYRAKQSGRGRFAFFSSAIQREIIESQRVADDILFGLERKEFFPVYQPQFSADTHELVGVEALVRWRHRKKGVLPPSEFLKAAEDLKVINLIDAIVFEQALEDVKALQDTGFSLPKLSVNISLWRLCDRELVRSLKNLNLPRGLIAFELIESIFLDDSDENVSISRTIRRIKQLGIDIEIDDFGTGHASVVGLLRVNPRRLKIAQQLVMPITRSRKQRRLVQSIIEMGKALGIAIIAEGVETHEHANILRELGCDVLQGYAFAKPMTLDALKDFVSAGAWR